MSQSESNQRELFPELAENIEPPEESFPSAFLTREADVPLLKSVRIQGLKSFDDCLIHLAPLTILTGPNNSGKSTVLQAIALGFECFRRCLDTRRWRLGSAGRSVNEFDFLPVNEPKDLWFEKVWKLSSRKERYVRVTLSFSNDIEFSARLRFLYGGINLGVDVPEGGIPENVLKQLAASSPVMLPATPGPSAHEDYYPLAQIHRFLSMRQPSRVLRNVVLRLAQNARDGNGEGLKFVNEVISRYFSTSMQQIDFDESKDLELRTPLRTEGTDYSLDTVSAGSGLNQILMLASVLAWRKPGLVLLDEPDAHLHSSIQAQLLDFLGDLADQYNIQIIAATHSRDLISRAPLEAIVPIDTTRSEVGPLGSLEHLLLEFERHGVVSNVDLALLYQSRRCVFVEGRTEIDLIPRIAERLDYSIFQGTNQVVLFDLSGVEKVSLVPELVRLFERLVGSRLSYGVIRDNDAHLPEVRSALEEQARSLGFPVFHMWSRYSLENFLVEPELLYTAIKRISPDSNISVSIIEELLDRAIDEISDNIDGLFITTAQNAYKEVLDDDKWPKAGAESAARYIKSLNTRDKKLAAYPGRRIFGKFVQHLQNKYGIQLRFSNVLSSLTRDNAPSEFIECLDKLVNVGKDK